METADKNNYFHHEKRGFGHLKRGPYMRKHWNLASVSMPGPLFPDLPLTHLATMQSVVTGQAPITCSLLVDEYKERSNAKNTHW